MSDAIEVLARALFESGVFAKFPGSAGGWDHAEPQVRMLCLRRAKDQNTALDAAGFAIVSKG